MIKKGLLLSTICLGIMGITASTWHIEALQYPVPEDFLPEFADFQLDPEKESHLALDQEGTVLHVPKDAFVDLEGNPITDPVTIHYKEYNNAADMAFSRIPMTYKGNNFNSSGMFEIKGTSKGRPIRVASGKSLHIDYQLAQKNPDTDFYRLDKNTNQWKLVADIPQMAKEPANDIAVVDQREVAAVEGINVNERNPRNLNVNVDWNVPRNDNRNWNNNINVIRGNRRGGNNFVMEDNGDRTGATLLAENADAGHTYPDIVKGLNVESFGVYNCDQIYRVPNRVTVNATFKDQNGKTLKDFHVLSLIDLNYNGAFSFAPQRFTCDAKGDNVILLFSTNDELYLLDKGEFAKMNIKEEGDYTFTVKNVTKTIKNTADLAKHLDLKV